MRYQEVATRATDAGLSPATVDDTCRYWQVLGVTRQTRWIWKNYPDRVPLTARLATAWHIQNPGAK